MILVKKEDTSNIEENIDENCKPYSIVCLDQYSDK